MKTVKPIRPKKPSGPNVFGLLKPYRGAIALLVLFALGANALNLVVPQIIANTIDSLVAGNYMLNTLLIEFLGAAGFIFIFTYLQSIMQTYASERVARDLRQDLSAKISRQSHTYIQTTNPSKLLTNLTADIDSIKTFVSQAVVSIASSLFTIIGAGILLISLNWKLGLAVLMIIPLIGGTFFVIFGRVRTLFLKSREVIDWLNKVINESILGAALIRVLNSQQPEYQKFIAANTKAKDLGMQILSLFASMIPIVGFVANLAVLTILVLGGHFVIDGTMTIGDFAAFNSYIVILIFPIFILGFVSSIMAQATASYQRISEVLNAPETVHTGNVVEPLTGKVALNHVTMSYGEKIALDDVSFTVPAGTRTAIIGPTAAGKTQLLYVLTGLLTPQTGTVEFDGRASMDYEPGRFYQQVGFVFQDSIIFNMSIRENIAFNKDVTDEAMRRAIETAELSDFVDTLPDKLETIVSERGTSLSGGQKQRIMLARALALNPKILLLDDFTARVDSKTEQKILANVLKNYPSITLISVTQKISSVEDYDQIVLLMEGEILATGTHKELLTSSPEYVQIYNSQRSTSHYELHAE
ncbi:MAG: ABC transporter ATP-binding protein [Patescibacteria group bacterium]